MTTQEIKDAVSQALADRAITAEPLTPADSENSPSDVMVSMNDVNPADIILDTIRAKQYEEFGRTYFENGSYTWATKEAALKEAELVQKRVVETVELNNAPWYLRDNLLADKIADGDPLNQIFEFQISGRALELFNFSVDHKVSEDQIQRLKSTLQTVVNTGGLGAVAGVSGIAIVSAQDLNGKGKVDGHANAIGRFHNSSGILLLSDRLLWDEQLDSDKYGLDEKTSRLETTFAHELGHASQVYNTMEYTNALSWGTKDYDVPADNYGSTVRGTRHILNQPAAYQEVFKNGRLEAVPIGELLNDNNFKLKDVKPNTDYAKTQAAEDYAEAAVPYFLDGRQTQKIDPIRRNAISNTLQAQAEHHKPELGPFLVAVEPVDLKDYNKDIAIQPQHLQVKTSITLKSKTEYQTYPGSDGLIDDYGNEVFPNR